MTEIEVKVKQAIVELARIGGVARELLVEDLDKKRPILTCVDDDRTRDGVKRLAVAANAIARARWLKEKLGLDGFDHLVDPTPWTITDLESLDDAADFIVAWIDVFEGSDSATDSEPGKEVTA